MERIEHLKHIKQELDREEHAIESFSRQLIHDTLNPENRYHIKELISEGGFKKVYRAYDSKTSRDVAYAQIESDDLTFTNRIIREARITAQLDHSNITPLYDVGKNEEGLYFTMKLMAGKKMSHWIQHPQPPRDQHFYKLLHHVIDVCEAVSYAHSKGILHLDIKPGNIHIGDFGETYLFDWGIAKVLNATDDEFLNLDMSQETQGTPGCMSPEQLNGDESQFCPQTDIFLIGGLLYSLYTGLRLTENRQECDVQSVHYPITNKDIFGEKIPESMIQIIKKATCKKIEYRYQTVEELKLDLDRYINHYPTSVDKHKALKLISAKILQHPYVSLAMIIVIVVSLVFLNSLSRLQLKHTKKLAAQHEKTIQKIIPFANMPARNILGFYDHPKAMQMADTLIETQPETSQAWMLKGLLEASRFNFKLANQAFDRILNSDMIVSSQNASIIKLSERIKKVLDDEIRDPQDLNTILHYIKTLNEGRFNSLLSRNYYEAHKDNLDQCISYFDNCLTLLMGKRSPKAVYHKEEDGLKVVIEGQGGTLSTSTFLGMPYHSLILKNFNRIHLPMLASASLKKLDLSQSSIGHIYFLPDLKLEWLDISNQHIYSTLYEGMPKVKTLLIDHLSFDREDKTDNLISLCRNVEDLSIVGIDPKSIFKVIRSLKHLRRLRCSDDQKNFLESKLKNKIEFEFIPESQPL